MVAGLRAGGIEFPPDHNRAKPGALPGHRSMVRQTQNGLVSLAGSGAVLLWWRCCGGLGPVESHVTKWGGWLTCVSAIEPSFIAVHPIQKLDLGALCGSGLPSGRPFWCNGPSAKADGLSR